MQLPEMAGTCGKDGRRRSCDANAVWQNRRKEEETKAPVEVVKRCGGRVERDRSDEMKD
jgi:hypothetical protein